MVQTNSISVVNVVQWRYNKESDDYTGYVGKMKIFVLFQISSHKKLKTIEGEGEWILDSTMKFLEPYRFTVPSSAMHYAECVLYRLDREFHRELKKPFRFSPAGSIDQGDQVYLGEKKP